MLGKIAAFADKFLHMQYLFLKLAGIFFFLFSLSACSILEPLELDENEQSSPEGNSPIRLSLSQGYVADTTLHLRVQLEMLDEVETDSVFVQLKGFNKGVIQEEQTVPLRNFTDKEVSSPGNTIFLPFTLAIKDIDRFTISCSWGDEGYKLAALLDMAEGQSSLPPNTEFKEASAPIKISELSVDEIELPCKSGLCSVRVNLAGRILRGDLSKEVKAVSLAYKLTWVPDGSLPPIGSTSEELEPDEKMLPFGNDVLPVEGFEFKVVGDKDLPKIPGGRFMPVVRILKYELSK